MKGSKGRTSSVRAVAASQTSAVAVSANLEADAFGPFTLAIDIGGTRVKGAVLSANGALAAEPKHLATPMPATPDQVIRVIASIASSMPSFARISAGFPGVVKHGSVVTAPNLGTASWQGFDLATELSRKFDTPARVLNDAAVQGLGIVEGPGLECVLTLGTGVGCAVYRAQIGVAP